MRKLWPLRPPAWQRALLATRLSTAEVNAAVEYLIDHLHPDIAPQIKLAKEMAAGAVLVVSLGALCVHSDGACCTPTLRCVEAGIGL